jgi:hypothetical protein
MTWRATWIINASRFLPDQFQYLLIPGMVSEGIEVRVVLDPRLGFVIGVREQALQQIESRFYVAQEGVNAGDVILSEDIVRIDRQRSG